MEKYEQKNIGESAVKPLSRILGEMARLHQTLLCLIKPHPEFLEIILTTYLIIFTFIATFGRHSLLGQFMLWG